jgi:tetratricopeptide (TPR) repeat protein
MYCFIILFYLFFILLFFSAWESIYVNLGHVYRKQQRWQEAEDIYMKALSHVPGQPSTFAALGYTYHLQVPPTPTNSPLDSNGILPTLISQLLDSYISHALGGGEGGGGRAICC